MNATTSMHEHHVPSSEHKWLSLYVRERLSAGKSPTATRGAVLFVHGSFQPGCGFDSSAAGYSWLVYLAEKGFATYFVDLRGYGKSSKPPAHFIAETGNKPFCPVEQAVTDIADAVNFVCARTSQSQVFLVGFSWGTLTVPTYAAMNAHRVRKMVLVAPCTKGGKMAQTSDAPAAPDPGPQIFIRGFDVLRDAEDPNRFNRKIGAMQRWSVSDSRRHDLAAMRGLDPAIWRVPEVGERSIADLEQATGVTGDIIEGPGGSQLNLFQFYIQGRQFYDPLAITMPAMIIRGDRDFAGSAEGAQEVLDSLGTAEKYLVCVGNAGHGVFRQKPAKQVFALSEAFFGH